MNRSSQFLRWWLNGFWVALTILAQSAAMALVDELPQQRLSSWLLEEGFIGIFPLDSSRIGSQYALDSGEEQEAVAAYCNRLAEAFRKYGWKEAPCGDVAWKAQFKTPGGWPLIYAEFGVRGKATTLFLGGVHPDEITPIHLAFRLGRYLKDNEAALNLENYRVVVAPLVNPDSFLRKVPLRTNSVGIDPNRNFPTIDWYYDAHQAWQERGARARYFPGFYPDTAMETVFQMHLIESQQPDKIISIHAPLGFLDYDGPGDQKPGELSMEERRAKQLVHSISAKSANYRIVDYSFFPGSLGNYAGMQNSIPTVTLELKTTNPKDVEIYWNRFQPGLIHSILYPFKTSALRSSANEDSKKAPR